MTRARNHAGTAGGSVAEALRLLGRDSTPAPSGTRDGAAKILLAEMELWAPSVVWKAYSRQLRELPTGEAESLIADAVQSLAFVASTSESYFRGDDEASARAWCRRVLLNHISTELRERSRQRNLEAMELLPDHCFVEECDAARTTDESVLSAELAQAVGVLRAIRTRVYSTHRRRDAETTMRAVFCYVAYLSGATLDEQVRALEACAEGATNTGDAAATRERRLRNRVYKLRERGRRAIRSVRRLSS